MEIQMGSIVFNLTSSLFLFANQYSRKYMTGQGKKCITERKPEKLKKYCREYL